MITFSLTTFVSCEYGKVPSSNTSHFEAHTGIYRLSSKGIFNAFGEKNIFELVIHVRTCDYMVTE